MLRYSTDGNAMVQMARLIYRIYLLCMLGTMCLKQVVLDVIAHYDYVDVSNSLTPSDVNEWKNKVLFKN